mmetsp:Transcript_10988/g.22100  ORF Transcript_10988/g.22100 Transcript_10988/m.22100 type:complete len:85 (+) Transcript_10988:279-533(+)
MSLCAEGPHMLLYPCPRNRVNLLPKDSFLFSLHPVVSCLYIHSRWAMGHGVHLCPRADIALFPQLGSKLGNDIAAQVLAGAKKK